MLKKTRYDSFPDTVRVIHESLKIRYGYTSRITRIWEMLLTSLGMSEIGEVEDSRFKSTPQFDSWIMDRYIEWANGKEVDLEEVGDAIRKEGSLGGSQVISKNDLSERVWAIFLTVLNPE